MKFDTLTQLILAIIQIESGGDNLKVNKAEQAFGCLQIREIYVEDVNRILKLNKDPRRFTHGDAFNRDDSIDMFMIYVFYWAEKKEQKTGRPATYEDMARIHNGGPNGWKKENTKKYWEKLKKYGNGK